MKVARYYNNKDIRIEEMDVPSIGEGEILVKVKASGICGTDVMEWYRTQKGPRILGHEIAGDIIESQSEQHKVGQRVFVSHHVPCYQCKYCMKGNHTACETLHKGNYDPGGYSEFVRVPRINVQYGVYPFPDLVSYEEGTMIEPLACAMRGLRVANVEEGQKVLILGCGVSGLLNIQLAKRRKAQVFATDMDEFRLKRARGLGADQVFKPDEITNEKMDRIILCTGSYSAVEQAFQLIDKKGIILLFAIPSKDIILPTVDIWRNEVTITSSYGAAPMDLREALQLIYDQKVDVRSLITHRFPLEDIQTGFDTVVAAQESLKVVLLCNQEKPEAEE